MSRMEAKVNGTKSTKETVYDSHSLRFAYHRGHTLKYTKMGWECWDTIQWTAIFSW